MPEEDQVRVKRLSDGVIGTIPRSKLQSALESLEYTVMPERPQLNLHGEFVLNFLEQALGPMRGREGSFPITISAEPIVAPVRNIVEGAKALVGMKVSELPAAVAAGVSDTAKTAIESSSEMFRAAADLDAARFAGASGKLTGLGAQFYPPGRFVTKYLIPSRVARSLRLGRTIPDPQTGRPLPPMKPINVETGQPLPHTAVGRPFMKFHRAVDSLVDGLGGKTNIDMRETLQEVVNEALPDLKYNQQHILRDKIRNESRLKT
jgi:hypothetical protein